MPDRWSHREYDPETDEGVKFSPFVDLRFCDFRV